MSFVPGNPSAGQSLGSSRPFVQGNLDSLYTTFLVNHQDINLSNPGTHTHVDMLAQASNPNPPTGQISHYSKSVSGVTEWFMQREGSGTVIQMSAGNTQANINGYTFLPGGMIMQWGQNTSTGGVATVNFHVVFPNTLFSVMVSPNGSGTIPTASWYNQTTSGFTCKTSAAAILFNWIAIGN